MHLRWMDNPTDFSAIFHKGDCFGDFLFAFLGTKFILKGGLL